MADEDKHIVEEELNMSTQYKDFLREKPVVHQFIIESEIKGMREMLLRTLSLRFSDSQLIFLSRMGKGRRAWE